jgi:5'-phosphate synthase pdxT subunit
VAIGVLALQGAVREHVRALERLGVESREVRTPQHLGDVKGLIIPGGESTTVGKLMARIGLDAALKDFAESGSPIMGTCAGMILLARKVDEGGQPLLGLMDIVVRRNAFGRQVDSFEQDLDIAGFNGVKFRGVFIRAPYIVEAGRGVEVLAEVEGKGVLARQGKLIAAAFHPELTDDMRLHKLFVDLAEQ